MRNKPFTNLHDERLWLGVLGGHLTAVLEIMQAQVRESASECDGPRGERWEPGWGKGAPGIVWHTLGGDIPQRSMYGISSNVLPSNDPHVAKHSLNGAYGT